MAFDVADRAWIDSGGSVGHLDDRGLTGSAGGGEPDLGRAVIVDASSAYHRVDVIAVGNGVLQPFEEDDARAAAENGSGCIGVERTAGPIRRHHAAFEMLVTAFLRECDRYAAGERHVRLVEKQTLTCLCDGQQRRGARRLQGKARTFEIQFVGNPGRQKVRACTQQQRITPHLVAAGEFFDGAPVPAHVVEQIRVDTRPGEYADGAPVSGGVVARVLQGFP